MPTVYFHSDSRPVLRRAQPCPGRDGERDGGDRLASNSICHPTAFKIGRVGGREAIQSVSDKEPLKFIFRHFFIVHVADHTMVTIVPQMSSNNLESATISAGYKSREMSGNHQVNTALKPNRDRGIGAIPILLNFVKGMVGPGCLYLPLAFKQAGLYAALVLILIFGFLNNWCMLKIVHCSQHFSKTNGDIPLDYGSVAQHACANSFSFLRKYQQWSKYAVDGAVISLQVGICSVSFCFMAQHLREVSQEVANVDASEKIWMLILLLPVVLINFVGSLRSIAVFSVIGYVFMLGSLLIIFQHLLRAPHPNVGSLPWITHFDGVMTACGLILYSFEGQAMVLPLENRLKRPHYMVGPFGVLSMGMAIVTFVYSATGIIGYATYGEHIKGSISLSLPPTLMFTIVKLALTLVVFFGFVLQQYVIVDVLWPAARKYLAYKNVSEHMCQYLEMAFRVLLVFLAMSIAFIVPILEQIISFVGITSGTLLAFIFPTLIDTMTFLPILLKEEQGTSNKINWRLYLRFLENASLILVGLFGLCAGLQANIRSMLESEPT